MKKTFIKRSTAGLLALLLCITGLFGMSATTVYAAGETAEAVMIAFPRDGDANYDNSGTWGHSSKTYMNGWFAGEGKYSTVYAIGSWTGNICYCIEPGTPLAIGDKFVSKDESYWDNYPSTYNHTITPYEIKHFIGRIFQYGYTGTISTGWRSQNSADADKLSHALATQICIWETVVGERDSDFNHVDTGKYDTVLSIIGANHPLRSQILNHYNSIVSNVQKHSKVPSFCAKTTGKAQNIELDWDGSKYTTTLTDTNNVLANYKFTASQSGITFSTNGNKLTITATTAPSSTVSITAEKVGSVRSGVIVWDDGTYAPGVGKQNLTTFAQTVKDPVEGYVNIKVSTGSAKIVKTSEDGKIEGISFTLSGNGVNQSVKTNSKGEVQIDNLMPGVYTVTEQAIDRYEPQETHRVTVVSGQVGTVTFNNVLKRGDVKVIKSSEDGFNEGVKFHLSGTSLAGIAVDEYAVTNKDGVATFEDVLISGSAPYTIEEMNTAVRYVIPENQTTPVVWNEVTSRTFVNVLKKFTVTVTKSDSEKGHAQGNASLGGAVYGIYKGGALVDKYTTDNNGQFVSKEYVCGDDWTVKEIAPSEGYLLDNNTYKIGAEAKNYTVEHNQTANDVTEDVIKGNMALIKHTDDGETKLETPENGASFEIYLKSSGSFEGADADERDTIVCDENGFGMTKDMPYGIYTVHQTKGWEGRELMDDFDVFISSDGQTYRYLINNRNFESYVKVVKVDAETQKVIPYAGAGFKLFASDGTQITMSFTYPTPTTIDTFFTDANGCLVTPEKLAYGKGYSIVEVQAPYGYVLNSDPVYFDITADHAQDEAGITVVNVTRPNMPQKGIIHIEKTGEVFESVISSDDIYQPVYKVKGLKGATFEIRAAEDIFTLDGEKRYAEGELVDTITTGSDGIATSKELYLGKYTVKEITAPYGMVLNEEIQTVELIYAGQEVAVTEISGKLYNDRQKVKVSLSKVLEQNELFGIGMNGELSSISFGLYAQTDLVAADGTKIPTDGLIEIITFDENGLATVSTDLPFGSYYVKERSTDDHYILSDAKYGFEFTYESQETAVVELTVNNGAAIENKLKYGSVSGLKIDEDGNAVAGAVFGLFGSDENEYSRENAFYVTESAQDGTFKFEKIPYGIWVVREIEPAIGFVLNENAYQVNITDDGQIIEIQFENRHICGTVRTTKVDKDYPDNRLTGATFEIYQDVNGNKEYDADIDTLVGEMIECELGIYELEQLRFGGYFLYEKVAPVNYVKDEDYHYFEIVNDGETVEVENEAGIGFINNHMVGNLKIVKTSSDGRVEGFSFRVVGTNYDEVFVTDSNGEIFIENLRIGKYTVTEVEDSVSADYKRPDPVEVELVADETLTVNVHNDKITVDVPKTGDDSHMVLWFGLLMLSLFGLAGTAFFCRRKRHAKAED